MGMCLGIVAIENSILIGYAIENDIQYDIIEAAYKREKSTDSENAIVYKKAMQDYKQSKQSKQE